MDDDEDLALPYWAGLVPVNTTFGPPESAPDLRQGIEAPPYALVTDGYSTAGNETYAAFGRRSIPAKQPVVKPARRSAGDPSRPNSR